MVVMRAEERHPNRVWNGRAFGSVRMVARASLVFGVLEAVNRVNVVVTPDE